MIRLLVVAAFAALSLLPAAASAQDGHADHAHHTPAPRPAAHAEHGATTIDSPEAHGHRHADFASDRFHVRVDGDGPRDIVFIPGHSSSPRVWDETIAHLGAGWTAHSIHVQGFAGAPVEGNAEGPVAAPVAEDIARYIREQGLEKPIVVGHSMGGTIGMMLAARHPDLVGKLMVVDMVPFMGAMFARPGTNPTAEAVTPIADQMAAAMAASPREAYVAQATTAINGMINTADRREAALADMRATDQQVAAHAYRELIVTDLRPELPAIMAPTEVLYVTFNYPGMTPEMTDGIYAASFAGLPGVTLTRIDDSAHFIMWDQPAQFQAELDAFVAD